jgi:hypothetical protein
MTSTRAAAATSSSGPSPGGRRQGAVGTAGRDDNDLKGKPVKSRLFSLAMWVMFLAGLIGCVDARHLVHGTQHQHLVTFGGIALSLAAGSYVMRREPLKSWLRARPVMWFLFLFNLCVAVAAPFFLHGSQGIMAAAGMGIVSLGAGMGLLRSRASAAHTRRRRPGVPPSPGSSRGIDPDYPAARMAEPQPSARQAGR